MHSFLCKEVIDLIWLFKQWFWLLTHFKNVRKDMKHETPKKANGGSEIFTRKGQNKIILNTKNVWDTCLTDWYIAIVGKSQTIKQYLYSAGQLVKNLP